MEYARHIQPFRGKSSFQTLADVLNLPGGLPGGLTQCFNVTYDGPDVEFHPNFTIVASIAVFVSPNGSDMEGSGTIDSPFATAAHALAFVRQIRNDTAVPAAIVFRNGTYELVDTINLGPGDSNLTLQNYNGEEVWLSGGRTLQVSWSAVPGKPHVYSAQLAGMGVKEITGLRIAGLRAVRARYPNGCTSNQSLPSGYQCQGWPTNNGTRVVDPNDGFGSNLLSDWVFPPKPTMHQPNWTEFNPATPRRLSGLSFQTYQIGIGGTCADFVPPAGYWCGNKCDGGAPAPPDCIARWPKGLLFNSSVLPNGPYKNPTSAVVHVWHPGHWSSWMFQVGSGNDTHLMFAKGGFQGARGGYPDLMADSFFVENVFEELDLDNEFFYDAQTQTLYYQSNAGVPASEIVLTNLKTLLSLTGTQRKPVENVLVLGVNLRDTALSYLDDHCMPSGGDWGLGRVAAVFAYGTVGLTLDSCVFERLDGNAVLLNGFARNATIQNCDFHEIGDNIIAQLGETEGAGPVAWGMGPDGSGGNQPRGTLIQNNFAYRCGLFEKQSSFYFQAKSCQNVLRNNIFFHGPRAGINFNDGFGGGSVLNGNLMFATVMESGDHGPFNSWDRQVYAHEKNADGTLNIQKDYDEIFGNFFIGNYYGQEAIDNDDGSAFYETHHNFFAYAETGMKNDFNGHDNHHHHNIYGYITQGVGICGALPGHADKFYSNRVIQLGSTAYADYDCGCNSTNSCPELHDNTIYTPDASMGEICGMTLAQRQAMGVDVGTQVQLPPTDDQIIAWARELLDLPPPTVFAL